MSAMGRIRSREPWRGVQWRDALVKATRSDGPVLRIRSAGVVFFDSLYGNRFANLLMRLKI